LESKFEFAKELVKKAGQYILDHMQEDLQVETKSSPTDLVTRLDKEVQELLVGEILSRYPEDKICAEEGCLRASVQEGKVWVIDPIDGTKQLPDLLDERLATLEHDRLGVIGGVGPVGRNLELVEGGGTRVDGLPVGLDDGLTLLGVGLLGRLLHVREGLLGGKYLGQGEERGLEHRVRTLAHADLLGEVNGIDEVDVDVVLGDIALGDRREVVGDLLVTPLAVHEEGATGLDVAYHLEALGYVGRVVAGHEVRGADEVGRVDGVPAEAQVRFRHAAGLFRVVLEVRLDIEVRVIPDDLDGVLVRPDRTVGAQPPELAVDRPGVPRIHERPDRQGEVSDVVVDTHRKMVSGLGLAHVVEHRQHLGGRDVLGREPIAPGVDGRVFGTADHRGRHVLEQRLPGRPRLLRPVQNGDPFRGPRQSREQALLGEGAVEMDLQKAHLLPPGGGTASNRRAL